MRGIQNPAIHQQEHKCRINQESSFTGVDEQKTEENVDHEVQNKKIQIQNSQKRKQARYEAEDVT